jgi:hypothetical protein
MREVGCEYSKLRHIVAIVNGVLQRSDKVRFLGLALLGVARALGIAGSRRAKKVVGVSEVADPLSETPDFWRRLKRIASFRHFSAAAITTLLSIA